MEYRRRSLAVRGGDEGEFVAAAADPADGPDVLASGHRRNLIDLAADRLVAFARARLQPGPIDDLDMAAVIANKLRLLQRISDDRHGRAAHAQHLREELVGQLDVVAFEPVAGLQQPAAQAGFDGVQGIAGGGLLHLDEQHLAVVHDDVADGPALFRGLPKARGRDARARALHLHHGARVRTAGAEPGQRPDRAFVSDRRRLDRVTLLHYRQQRDDAVVGEIDLVDAFALLLEDHALFERDLLQVRRQ